MSVFFLAMVATLLASMGGRDQALLAQLAGRHGQACPLLAAGWVAVLATSVLAAIAATLIAPLMQAPARAMLVAFALALGALELVWRWATRPPPQEPTRSFFATLVVLFAQQLGDSARFLIFVLAIAKGAPVLACAGGVLGSGAALTAGWAMGEGVVGHALVRALRLATAAGFMVAACVIALSVWGLT